MSIKNFLKRVVLAIGLMNMTLGFTCPNTIYAEEIAETVENVNFEYDWSQNESEDEAKEKALLGAKRKAIEMFCAFIEPGRFCEDKDFRLIKDEIISTAIAQVTVLGEPRFEMDQEKRICKVTIDTRVTIDPNKIPKPESKPKCEINKTKSMPFINKDKSIHYYQIFDIGLDWYAAKVECEKEPRCHLATIGSKEEQKFIEELLINQGTRNCYWLGGEKIGSKFFWVDNTPFTYTNWAKWQPDNPTEKALMIYKNTNPRAPLHVLGTWADLRADGTSPNENDFFGFICEWDS